MKEPRYIHVRRFETELGEMIAGVFEGRLCLLDYAGRKDRARLDNRLRRRLGADFRAGGAPLLEEARRQAADYLAGRRRGFDLPLRMAGTAFQQRVWRALMEIPYGETISYAELARRIGRPRAARAVAGANAANAMSLVIPCHRVIASDGSVSGYAGGPAAKRALLRLEGARPSGAEW